MAGNTGGVVCAINAQSLRDYCPIGTLHTAVTHMTKVLEWWSLRCLSVECHQNI